MLKPRKYGLGRLKAEASPGGRDRLCPHEAAVGDPKMQAAPAIGFPEFFRQDRDGRPRGVIQVVRSNSS